MKKFTLIVLSITVLLALLITQSYTNSIQPQAGKTGCNVGTVEQTCGISTCHNTNPNIGPGGVSITFSDPDLKYVPGTTYDMTVTTATETGKVKFGFEITSVTSTGDSVGTLIVPTGVTNISKPTIGAVASRKYLAHKNASATNTWTFQWKAPAVNKGTLIFFAAGNAANGNGNDTGDNIYTTSLSITPDSTAGIFSPNHHRDPSFAIQSIAYNQITLQYNNISGDETMIRLYDLSGKLVQTLMSGSSEQGLQTKTFSLERNLTTGLYVVSFTSGNVNEGAKIFIQK